MVAGGEAAVNAKNVQDPNVGGYNSGRGRARVVDGHHVALNPVELGQHDSASSADRMRASMSERSPVVQCNPQILGGTAVFAGTRVPLRNLIDYLERGHSLDVFLDAFPSVSREQAIAALEAAHEALAASARAGR